MLHQATNRKINCWEFMGCGREPGGANVAALCVCPAASITMYPDGKYNGGICLGRRCWRVAGTLCGGVVQGTYASKIGNCRACPFYQKVQEEEGAAFVE